MLQFLWVGLGGFLGSALRFQISGLLTQHLGTNPMPFGTLGVNLIGCLVLGFLGSLAETRAFLSPEARLLLIVGLLGGFTTFSSYGYESLHMIRHGHALAAGAYILVQTLVGLFAVWLGHHLAKLF